MSAAHGMRRLRDRPIAEHERHAAISAVVVVLTASTLALALTGPPTHAAPRRPATAPSARPTEPKSIGSQKADLDSEERRVATRFLGGYLNYVYHGVTRQIADATASLIASLQAHPPRIPPGIRAGHPRVVSVKPAPTGEARVIAMISDGGPVDYPIALRLTLDRGRMLVSEVGGA